MIRACTASVIAMKGTSRSNTISGSPSSAAAAAKPAGRPSVYRRPSSTASALTPTPASSDT